MTVKYNFLAQQLYGMGQTQQQELSVVDRDLYGRAVLTIAAADGLSPSEREYFVNLARGMDMPDDFAEKYADYDTSAATLEDLLSPLRGKLTHPVPYLLYDAIKVSSVDGYSDKERTKVAKAAEILGVSTEHVRALEGLVAAENSVREARLGLFAAIAGGLAK
jgi:hypothetical protein